MLLVLVAVFVGGSVLTASVRRGGHRRCPPPAPTPGEAGDAAEDRPGGVVPVLLCRTPLRPGITVVQHAGSGMAPEALVLQERLPRSP